MPFIAAFKNADALDAVLEEIGIKLYVPGLEHLLWVEERVCACPEHEDVVLAIYTEGAIIRVSGQEIRLTQKGVRRVSSLITESRNAVWDEVERREVSGEGSPDAPLDTREYDEVPSLMVKREGLTYTTELDGRKCKHTVPGLDEDITYYTIGNVRYKIRREDAFPLFSLLLAGVMDAREAMIDHPILGLLAAIFRAGRRGGERDE